METQKRGLEERLSSQGWRIVVREPEPDWWLDELWVLESEWRPVGLRLWLSFLVDPGHSGQRRQGEQVWAVALTANRPRDRQEAEPTFPIRRHWAESLEALVAAAERRRNQPA